MKFFDELAKIIRKSCSKRGYVCDGCGAEIFTYPLQRLCVACEQELHRNVGKTCEKCGRATVAEGVCLLCKQTLPKFDKGISPFVYRSKTAALINRIKNGNRRLAYFFGENMAEILERECPQILQNEAGRYALNDENTPLPLLIVPVPITKTRERERGYNQALCLAEAAQAHLVKKGYLAELDGEALQQRKEIAPQKRQEFFSRAKNVEGAFHVLKRAVCKDRTVLLIDDIMTTGATGSECAARLLGAGAKRVIFLTAAALPERK